MSAIKIPSERSVPQSLRWYYYIHLCGQEGRNWVQQYEMVQGMEIARKLDQAISLSRRRRLTEAQDLMKECSEGIRVARRKVDSSVLHVMDRWYFSTQAYLTYVEQDYDKALEQLGRSSESILRAIEKTPFLIGLASGFAEFTVHYARIARDQCRWEEMRRHFALARDMANDTRPLCQLRDGRRIFWSSIHHFIASLTPADEEDAASLRFLLNRQIMIDALELLIRRVEAMPNVVIPFV
jgi:hypothetical protein